MSAVQSAFEEDLCDAYVYIRAAEAGCSLKLLYYR